MALIATLNTETSAAVSALAEFTADIGSCASGASSFTLTLPNTFVANYPIAVIPVVGGTGNAIDGGTAGPLDSSSYTSIVSTSLSGSTLTVNVENSHGSGVDPGTVRFLVVQFKGEK